ncbi:MAG: GNAT family N-acetyltransferase [Rhizobiaceae bacterium]
MNLDIPTATHETDRLLLRPFVADDQEQYAQYHSRLDVYRYLYTEAPTGDALNEQFRLVLASRFEKDGDIFRLAVIRKEDGAIVGEVLLKLANRSALQGEVGYIFNPAFARKGYATEAVAAMLRIGFEEIGFHRIFARLDAANTGSLGVVERLGLRREAHFLQNDRFNDQWGDEFVYAILKSEWDGRKAVA